MSAHVGTVQNEKKGTERGQRFQTNRTTVSSKRLPKTHQDYWKSRLKKRSYKNKNEELKEIPDWQVRMKHSGRESWFNLYTSNKTAAAAKAREIYINLSANGWPDTLGKYKKHMELRPGGPTVGDFIEAITKTADVKQTTLHDYIRRFRTVVAGIKGYKMVGKRIDSKNGGRAKWLERVNAVKLHQITPEKVQQWKLRYLASRSHNPIEARKARITVNSNIRGAKGIFTKKMLRFVNIELPDPLPFDGVSFEKVGGSHRYKSEIDAPALICAAFEELRDEHPEPFKIFLLALGAGLRRREIDCLTWKQMNFDNNTIQVETNEYGSVKTAFSEEEVDVDPTVMMLFKCYQKESTSPLVIESIIQPRQSVTYRHYRSNQQCKVLINWLRSKGITSRNPIHALRKEFGSLICAEAGIFAASAQLRHSTIQITRDHYVDKKTRATVKIGQMLNTPDPDQQSEDEDKIVPFSKYQTA